MADEVVADARQEVDDALDRFRDDLFDYVNDLVDEMVDVDRMHQIRDLLNNLMNTLDANVLLHPDNPAAQAQAQTPEEIPISDDAPHASE